ncbi:hypothetical protein AGOR_G00128930 [Albula goreensis]|uniref:Cysteine and histidine-rich domain-containing protein 1 n=1 Tax=Albula goreensis TaxID=1534307 RepID=A0A8T3DB28_9TELE|nr:hypothetical protein AGOR_G00128930 [Albula goreensis]
MPGEGLDNRRKRKRKLPLELYRESENAKYSKMSVSEELQPVGAQLAPQMDSSLLDKPPSPPLSYLSMESDMDYEENDRGQGSAPPRVRLERPGSPETRQSETSHQQTSHHPQDGTFLPVQEPPPAIGPEPGYQPYPFYVLNFSVPVAVEKDENLSPMGMPFVFKSIQKVLEELTPEELTQFKQYMPYRFPEHFENLRMEDFDVLDVVDKMLERCGKGGAVKVAMRILSSIKRDDLEQVLGETCKRIKLQHDLKVTLKRRHDSTFEGIPRPGRCGQRFDPDKNPDDACTFHPGIPVFHDALKGWSCCKRRTTDFSDFLSIAGCTKGPHNREKPPEPVKPDVKTSGEKKELDDLKPKFNEYVIQAPKPLESIQRPSADEPVVRLQQKVSSSLKQALEKLKLSESNEPEKKEEEGDEVKIGTSCKNGGCQKTFSGPGSNEETCMYHPGVPIFHEGMKYWSCCKRKTSDFNTFLSQEGCAKGKHLWRKDDTGKKIVPCRFDWHQTGGQVMISIYAKNSVPELSYVEGNSTKLNIHVIFEGEKEFVQNINLWGVIDVNKSVMNMMATKIEIAMKKAEPMTWARLDLPPLKIQPAEKKEEVADEDAED